MEFGGLSRLALSDAYIQGTCVIVMGMQSGPNTHPTVGPYPETQAIEFPVTITISINTLVGKEGRVVNGVLLI
jgi:hypothetical protein